VSRKSIIVVGKILERGRGLDSRANAGKFQTVNWNHFHRGPGSSTFVKGDMKKGRACRPLNDQEKGPIE